jgi:hypothetical protein
MAKTVPVRDDFEPLFYDEIGRLVVAAGRVEYVLKLCLKQLVGKGFTAGIFEAEEVRHLAPLCDEVEKHAKSKLNGDQQKNFCAVIDTIRLLADERNDAVHALWTTTESREPLRVRPQLKGKKGSRSVDWSRTEVVSLGELRRVRRQLEDAHASLQDRRNTWT